MRFAAIFVACLVGVYGSAFLLAKLIVWAIPRIADWKVRRRLAGRR